MEPPSPLSVRATIRCPRECRTNLVARLYVRRLVNQRSRLVNEVSKDIQSWKVTSLSQVTCHGTTTRFSPN